MPDNDAPVAGNEAQEVEASDIKLQYERVPDFKMYYCNNLQISPGIDSSVQFFFGQILAPMVGEKPKAINCTQLFAVSVTLDLARRILDLLDRQIKVTEELYKTQKAKEITAEKSNVP
jgi:hypothetical protein